MKVDILPPSSGETVEPDVPENEDPAPGTTVVGSSGTASDSVIDELSVPDGVWDSVEPSWVSEESEPDTAGVGDADVSSLVADGPVDPELLNGDILLSESPENNQKVLMKSELVLLHKILWILIKRFAS